MKQIHLYIIVFLCVSLGQVYATGTPEVWHRPNSLIAFPKEDSIVWTDEYTIFTVVRSLCDSAAECLWSFAEDDTISAAVLTQGIYTTNTGTILSRRPDFNKFSKWCVYAYHSGIYADSTKRHSFCLGEQLVYTDTTTDTLRAKIEMEEIAYFRGNVSRSTSDAFQTYLALKYGITLDHAPYISQQGDTLWHPIYDEEFYHRIVGIGSDPICNWIGCVSQSKENPLLFVQADTLPSNEYVLVGDDNGSQEWYRGFDNEYIMPRVWRVRQRISQSKPLIFILRLSAMYEVADSLRMIITDANGAMLQTILPDSIVQDSLCYFALHRTDTLVHLQIRGVLPHNTNSQSNNPLHSQTNDDTNIVFDASRKKIIVRGYADNQVFTLYLYDSLGKYMATITSLSPIDVKILPNMVSYIEVVTDNQQIVGAINVPITMY